MRYDVRFFFIFFVHGPAFSLLSFFPPVSNDLSFLPARPCHYPDSWLFCDNCHRQERPVEEGGSDERNKSSRRRRLCSNYFPGNRLGPGGEKGETKGKS